MRTALLALLIPGLVGIAPAIAAEPVGSNVASAKRELARARPLGDAALAEGPTRTRGDLLSLARLAAAGHDRVVVQVDDARDLVSVRTQAEALGARVRHVLPSLRSVSLLVPEKSGAALAAALGESGDVTSVRTAVQRRLHHLPNDTQYSRTAVYLDSVGAPAAWDVTKGDPSVRIAVVDSGVDVEHPDLVGKVVGVRNVVVGANPDDVTDDVGHGTLVAGVAAAAGDNGTGIVGAGFHSSILAVKVADSAGDISVDDAAAGIVWAVDHGADVINLSFGSGTAAPIETSAVAYAQSKGVVVVASAGNDSSAAETYPAALPGVLAVGSAGAAGQRSDFSNFGAWVSVAAPGDQIFSTSPTAGSALSPGTTGYDSADGTSFSAPLVAGQAALLLAQAPGSTAAQVRSAITSTARGYAGQGLGSGQVDFLASLSALPPATVPTVTAPSTGQQVGGNVVFTATSTAPTVRFLVDGVALGAPVPVSGGAASQTWQSWGAVAGAHGVVAQDCNAHGCGQPSTAVGFDLRQALPAISSPAAAASVSGSVAVRATVSDGAPFARLLVDGAPHGPLVGVVGGAADLSWLSTGRDNGPHELAVAACGSTALCDAPARRGVVVANAAPAVSAPTEGALVTGPTTITATGPAGGKLFRRNGAVIGFDASAPFSITTDFSSVADASYGLTVQSCGATQAECGGRVSTTRTVRTRSLRPALSVSPAHFSPNGDGRAESTTARLSLTEPMSLRWRVTDALGRVVRGPSSLGARASGSHAFVWNGRSNGSTTLPNGVYTLSVDATRVVGTVTLRGTARRQVRVDVTAPTMAVTPQAGGVYPVVDGFRDRLEPKVRLSEAGTLMLTVRSLTGATVRTITARRNAGTTFLSWSGTNNAGTALPAGTYRYAYSVQDAVGNRRTTGQYSIGLSRARLVSTTQSKVVTAQGSRVQSLVGDCSEVDISSEWPDEGLELLSDYYYPTCDTGDSTSDLAATEHRFTLPAAVKYGGIRVSVTGRRTLDSYPDVAFGFYYTAAGDVHGDTGTVLGPEYRTRSMPTVSSAFLAGGRTLNWAVAATDNNYWTVRSFTVTWTSYVLR